MRAVLRAVVITTAICFAGLSGAATPPMNASPSGVSAPPANASIIVAKECRCVEKRWNGSCKRRECRDNW